METQTFCQSCSMPLDSIDVLGTEKDGTASKEYCKYCYQDGSFTHADMTLEEMTTRVMNRMDNRKIPPDIIEAAVSRLPHLKRWKDKMLQL